MGLEGLIMDEFGSSKPTTAVAVVPQNADYVDMALYTAQRNKLFMADQMLKKYPEIFSWCDIVVRPAINPEDYSFEQNFNDWAIWVDWTWTEMGCTKISCNPRGQDFDCHADKQPFAFRSGDTTWTACEPACFFRNDIPNTGGVHSLQTQYHNGKCFWVTSAVHAWMTDPTVRSNVRFKNRVNNLATGFDVTYEPDDYNVPTIKGRINKYYCDAFFQKLQENDCEETWWSQVLGYSILGQSLVKFAQQAAHPNTGTREQISLEPDTSKIPSFMLDKEVWQKHINIKYKLIKPDVLLSDLGFTADMLMPAKRGQFVFHNVTGIVERFIFYDSIEKIITNNRYKRRNFPLQVLSAASTSSRSKRDTTTTDPKSQADYNLTLASWDWDSIGDRFSTNVSLLVQMFAQKDFYIQLGTDYSWSLLSRKLGPAFKQMLTGAFSKITYTLTSNTSARIVECIAGHMMGEVAADLLVEFSAKFILMLTRLAVNATTVIGVIADIALFLDFIVMFGWDPLGLQNQMDSQILDMLREQAISARYKTGDADCEIDPLFFSKYVLNEKIGGGGRGKEKQNVTTKTNSKNKNLARESSENDSSLFAYNHKNYDSVTRTIQTPVILKPHVKVRRLELLHQQKITTRTTRSITHGNNNNVNQIRPLLFHDQTLFKISCLSEYLNARSVNSIGQRYEWDRDIVNSVSDTMTQYEIYSHLMQKEDVISYTQVIKARQYLSVLVLSILFCVLLFATTAALKPLILIIATPLIWCLAYIRFSNNKVHNIIWENIYSKFLT